MRNRAKCKLCNEVIESFHRGDYVTCKCDEIAVCGGAEKLEVFAKNWSNFIRLDDEGNEIVIQLEENQISDKSQSTNDMLISSQEDAIKMLEEFCQKIDALPSHARLESVTHADLSSVLKVVIDALRSS